MIRKALYQSFGILAERKIRSIITDSQSPRDAQERKLAKILATNANTQFGQEHGFSRIKSAVDFRKALPIRDYDEFKPYIEKVARGEDRILTADRTIMFATTSGTSGTPKYIPVTAGYMNEFRLASVVSGYHLLKSYPGIANGVTLSIVSSAEEGCTAGGIPYGAISGQLFKHEPYLIKKFISPLPYEVFLLRDYETRYYTLLRLAAALPLSCFYTLNPSTIALLCRRLQTYAHRLIKDVRDGTVTPPGDMPDHVRSVIASFIQPNLERAAELEALLASDEFVPHKIWPTLQVVSCWTKAAAAFYLADFPQYFGSVPVCDITYGASEGRGTVFMGPGKQMLALHSHFFEFIPEAEMGKPDAPVLLADQLEIGRNYFILFTTSGGLYRYNINDVVKVVGFFNRTPLLEFQYKGGNVCSFTGEKITELQVTAAMSATARQLNLSLRFFTVIPKFKPEPHYELWIELDDTTAGVPLERIADTFESRLSAQNIEYRVKRESLRLNSVNTRVLQSGTYESFRRMLADSGVADAQIKVSHLNPKPESRAYFEERLLSAEPMLQAFS